MVQGGFLNAYFLIWMPNNIYFYLFFIPDAACACLFMVAMMLSFQHLVRIHYGQSSKTLDAMFPVKMNHRFSVYYFGLFPLSYISWIFYTSILLTKIIMFLYFEIVFELPDTFFMGQQFLLVITGLAAFTFFFLVEGHTWSSRNSHRYVFVTLICALTALELIDTVTLLSLIYTYKDTMNIDVDIITIEYFVAILCMFSFFLPSLHLYMLSMTDRSADVMELPIATLCDVLHLLLIDFPYLAVRIYVLTHNDYSVLVMLLKNVFFIIVQLRHVIPDFQATLRRLRYAHKALQFQRRLARLARQEERRATIARASAASAASGDSAHSGRPRGSKSGSRLFSVSEFLEAQKQRVGEEEVLRKRRERHEQRKKERRLARLKKDTRSKATQTHIMPVVDTLWSRGYPRMRGMRVRIDEAAKKT